MRQQLRRNVQNDGKTQTRETGRHRETATTAQYQGTGTCSNASQHVDRDTCRTPHFHMHGLIAQYRRHVFLGSRCLRAQDELCAKNIHSSKRHVPSCASQYTEHQHKSLSPTSLCYCRPLVRTQTCCPRIHLSTVKIHGRMVLPRNSTPPQVMSPRGSSSTGFWSIHQNRTIDDQDDIEKIGIKHLRTSWQKALRRRPTRTSKTNN